MERKEERAGQVRLRNLGGAWRSIVHAEGRIRLCQATDVSPRLVALGQASMRTQLELPQESCKGYIFKPFDQFAAYFF